MKPLRAGIDEPAKEEKSIGKERKAAPHIHLLLRCRGNIRPTNNPGNSKVVTITRSVVETRSHSVMTMGRNSNHISRSLGLPQNGSEELGPGGSIR